jgi:hypothetical protein
MTELTPRMSGLMINPMITVQKLTQLASLLKQGKNCSKILLMNWNMERPPFAFDVVF